MPSGVHWRQLCFSFTLTRASLRIFFPEFKGSICWVEFKKILLNFEVWLLKKIDGKKRSLHSWHTFIYTKSYKQINSRKAKNLIFKNISYMNVFHLHAEWMSQILFVIHQLIYWISWPLGNGRIAKVYAWKLWVRISKSWSDTIWKSSQSLNMSWK